MTDLRECPNPECGVGVRDTGGVFLTESEADSHYAVCCESCWLQGPEVRDKLEAIRLWNLLPRRGDVYRAYEKGLLAGLRKL